MLKSVLPVLLLLLCVTGSSHAQAPAVLHQLQVELDIPLSRITGTLTTVVTEGAVPVYDIGGLSIDGVSRNGAPAPYSVKDRVLRVEAGVRGTLVIAYHAPLPAARSGSGFGKRSAFLTDGWYPRPQQPFRCTLKVDLPAGYEAVSEADGVEKTQSGGSTSFVFRFDHLRDRVTLIASDEYKVTNARIAGTDITLYLRAPSPLSVRRLSELLQESLARQERLFGELPYRRLSLVEGPLLADVLRPTLGLLAQDAPDPASLDRLVISQWFGGMVLPDRSQGDWTEALLTYLAGHGRAEREGRDWEFRKELLLRYAASVQPERELPLRAFREGTDSASLALGSAKGAMVFHMLRRLVGETAFLDGIRSIARLPGPASWDDIRSVFERTSGRILSVFFQEWVDRKGLADFSMEQPRVTRKADAYQAALDISQKGQVYSLEVPVVVTLRTGSTHRESVRLDHEKNPVTLQTVEEPRTITFDPDYDIARRLTVQETPPLIATLFGQDTFMLVSSPSTSGAAAPLTTAFPGRITIRDAAGATDKDIKAGSVAVIGRDNPVLSRLFGRFLDPEHGPFTAVARKNPWNEQAVIVAIDTVTPAEAMAALPRLTAEAFSSAVTFSGGKMLTSRTDPSQRGMTMELRERTLAVDVSTLRSLNDAVDASANSRIVYVGEYHDKFAHHAVQLDIIKSLYQKNEKLAIGMEMFQRPFQKVIDDYISGTIDERTFLRKTEYFKRWVFDYNLYKPILDFARRKKIPVVALNQRKEITDKVSRSGLDSLSEEERRDVPAQLDLSDSTYRDRLKTVFSQHKGPSERNFDFFYQAQVLWDETMALSVDEFLQQHPGYRMVVVAGAGHLAYGSGIPKRVYRRNSLPYFIALNDGEPDRDVANYLIFPPSLDGMTAPKLMAALKAEDKRVAVTDLPEDSVSKKAGIRPGDVILAVDGERMESVEDIKLFLFSKQQGDHIRVTVLRKRFFLGDKELTFDVLL